jgi:hypothetical protein
MNDNNHSKSIKDNVLKAIEAGKVTMRPRWHFVLKALLLLVGTILASMTLIFLISFIIFILHETGIWFIPGFGFHGIGLFFGSLPWLMLLLALVFIVMLEVLVRRYAFAYRKPLLYSTFGVIGLVILGGVIVSATPFHRGLFNSARNNNLPVAGGFYRQYGMRRNDHVIVGNITEIKNTGYSLIERRGQAVEVIISDDTYFPDGKDFMVGDSIVVLGDRNGDKINAGGIKKAASLPPSPEFERRRLPR